MTEPAREGQVLDAVVSLVDSLLGDFDVVELLTDLTERCAGLLDISAAGLLLSDGGQRLRLMAATSEDARELELFQLQSEEGPCLDCYATGEEVRVANLADEAARWPRFVIAAAEAGFVSAHAVPMRTAGMVIGALGLFGSSVGELGQEDMVVGQTLAHIATVAILQERAPAPSVVVPRLQGALASRVVVEQAKGYERARMEVTLEDASELLRSYALSHNLGLTELARILISDPAARPAVLIGLALMVSESRR
jgi:hypothetical protein